jgi:hypothetical protein
MKIGGLHLDLDSLYREGNQGGSDDHHLPNSTFRLGHHSGQWRTIRASKG